MPEALQGTSVARLTEEAAYFEVTLRASLGLSVQYFHTPGSAAQVARTVQQIENAVWEYRAARR